MIPLPTNGDDASAAIQQRLDRGGLVRMQGGGKYMLWRPVYVRDNTDWLLDDDVELIRGFDARGESNALVQTRAGTQNVAIRGLHAKALDGCRGKLLFIDQTTGLKIDGLCCGHTEDDWATAIKDCVDVLATDLTFDNGGGMYRDGLHFYGGRSIRVAKVRGKSGDDLVALSNEKLGDRAGETTPLEDVQISDVAGSSTHANVIRIRRVAGAHPVRNITIANVAGSAYGVGGIAIEGAEGFPVEDVRLAGVELDCGENDWEGLRAAFVNGLLLDRVTIGRPLNRPFYFDGCRDVIGRRLATDGPRAADRQCVLVGERHDCDGIDLAGDFGGATHHGIVMGAGGRVTNWRVAGTCRGQRLTPLYRGNCDAGDSTKLSGT